MWQSILRGIRAFFFSVGESFVNLRRHRLMTAAAVTTIAVSLILLGSFVLTFYQLHIATTRAANEFEMHVYCREQVSRSQLPDIARRIRAISGVSSVRFFSKEDAFREYTRKLPIDTTGIPNKFNDTFIVKMTKPELGSEVAKTVRGWHAEVQEVALPEAEMQGVVRIIAFLRTLGMVTGSVVLFGALVVVSNTIRLSMFNRRREIRIMQIVGAAPWFIRLPLFLEGLIHGLFGGVIASLCLYAADRSVQSLIEEVIPMLSHYFVQVDMIGFAGCIVVAGAAIGAFGSLLSIHRYLRVL